MIELISTDDEVLMINPDHITVVKCTQSNFTRILINAYWFQIKLPYKELLKKLET